MKREILSVVILQRLNGEAMGTDRFDTFNASFGGSHCCHNRDLVSEGRGADENFFVSGNGTRRGVDHEGDFLVLDQVDDVGTSFGELEKGGNRNFGVCEFPGCSSARNNLKAEFVKAFADSNCRLFVHIPDA